MKKAEIEVMNCISCPYSKEMPGSYNRAIWVCQKQREKQVDGYDIDSGCPLQDVT